MGSCVFQCDVPQQWIAQRQVGPKSVHCDGLGVMSCVCGMTILCGSTLVKVPLLQAGTVATWSQMFKATLNPNKQTNLLLCIAAWLYAVLFWLVSYWAALHTRPPCLHPSACRTRCVSRTTSPWTTWGVSLTAWACVRACTMPAAARRRRRTAPASITRSHIISIITTTRCVTTSQVRHAASLSYSLGPYHR